MTTDATTPPPAPSTAALPAAPPVNGRVVALAHYAARALLEVALAARGTTFHQNLALQAITVAGGSIDRDALVADVNGSLKGDESPVRAAVEELTTAKLLETDPREPSRLHLTDAGRELHAHNSAEGAGIAARLYAGIPAEDLAVTGRVLALITARANAELAGS